jgi:uncharacterized phage-associated protein
MTISFDFDSEKLVQTLAFFAARGVPDLTKMKAAKLLFYLDKKHLLERGRPVLGDVYYCLQHGPVPSFSLNIMNVAADQTSDEPVEGWNAFLDVVPARAGANRVIRSLKNPDLDVFSESEIQALEWVLKEHGRKTASQLRNETHEDPIVKRAQEARGTAKRAEIPYELFFEGQADSVREVLALAEAEQEDREFARSL